jgi:hypothetical protein
MSRITTIPRAFEDAAGGKYNVSACVEVRFDKDRRLKDGMKLTIAGLSTPGSVPA